jgi:hypothetical protein
MADIPQTNRTILLEQINPLAPDLLTVVGDVKGIDSLDDALVQKINEQLLVRDFPAFLAKFEPVVYSYFDAGAGSARYTLDKPVSVPEHMTIPLSDNGALRLVLTTFDAKKAAANFKFDYEGLPELISPPETLDDIRRSRKELIALYSEYQTLAESDSHKEECAARLNTLFQKIRINYTNVMALLPLAMEDSNQRLAGFVGESGRRHEKIAAAMARLGDSDTFKILAAPSPKMTVAQAEREMGKKLACLLEEDYIGVAGEKASDHMRALIARTFSPLAYAIETETERETEAASYNNYLQLYTDAKASFVRTAKPLLEKLLGVYAFFNQYAVQSKDGMRPSLLVANNKPETLAQSGNLDRLKTFLNTVNNKNEYADTVWFAIFPNLSLNISAEPKPLRQVFIASGERQSDTHTIEILSQLLNVLSAYQVMTFFSFETGEKTTFDYVVSEGVFPFLERCEPLIDKDFSAFTAPCLPNITIIPRERSGVIAGRMAAAGEDDPRLGAANPLVRYWIEGLYIPASYVAAGITAAWQCPEYLRQRFPKNVSLLSPGVRYDVEQGGNSITTVTTLARETDGFGLKVKEEINRKNFGFIFASEYYPNKTGVIDRLTVYKARSLGSDGAAFEPIYQTLVVTYFQRALRQMTGDNRADNIAFFFSSAPTSQMSQWLNEKEAINAVIQGADSITYDMEPGGRNCNIQFRFGGLTKKLSVTLNQQA